MKLLGYRCWKRILEIHLSSRKTGRTLIFGDKQSSNLTIHVSGYKYMSALKDTCTIEIKNLTYSQMMQIMNEEYYDVEVIAGYHGGNRCSVFRGGLLWMSNKLENVTTNTVILLCAATIIARFSQKRLNLSLLSGIDMKHAITQVLRIGGMIRSDNDIDISSNISGQILNSTTIQTNAADWLSSICNDNSYVINSDEINDKLVSIYDLRSKDIPVTELDNDCININAGYPTISSNGLNITIQPIYNFTCGTYIKIDNRLINVASYSWSKDTPALTNFLDKDGLYLIFQIQYSLENRGDSFSLILSARAKSLLSNFLGG